MSEAAALELPPTSVTTPAEPDLVTVEMYTVGQRISREPVNGFVFITDGEDGHWQPGWAEGDVIGMSDAAYWCRRGYKATHFAMLPAAPVDGVTI
jgi:hypothetical protein